MGGGKCLWEKNEERGGSLCLAAHGKRFFLPSFWAVAGQCMVAARVWLPTGRGSLSLLFGQSLGSVGGLLRNNASLASSRA